MFGFERAQIAPLPCGSFIYWLLGVFGVYEREICIWNRESATDYMLSMAQLAWHWSAWSQQLILTIFELRRRALTLRCCCSQFRGGFSRTRKLITEAVVWIFGSSISCATHTLIARKRIRMPNAAVWNQSSLCVSSVQRTDVSQSTTMGNRKHFQ